MSQYIGYETPKDSKLKLGDFDFDQWEFKQGTEGLNKAYPMPSIRWGLNYNRTPGGDLLSTEYDVTLDGVVTVHNNDSITKLMERANNFQDKIIQNNGKPFFYVFNEHIVVSGFAKIDSFSFNENQNYWRDYVSYTINMKIPESGSGSYLINPVSSSFNITSCSDTYTISDGDIQYVAYPTNLSNFPTSLETDFKSTSTKTLQRTISATAKAYADNESGALKFAQSWVAARDDRFPITHFFPADEYADPAKFCFYNKDRKIDFSETDGKYSITDTFLLKTGEDPWLYTTNVSTSFENNFLRKVNVQGEVIGLEPAPTGTNDYATLAAGSKSGVFNVSGLIQPYDYTFNDTSQIPGRGAGTEGSEEEEAEEGANHHNLKYANAVSGYNKMVQNGTFYHLAAKYDVDLQNAIPENTDGGSNGVIDMGKFVYKTRPLHGTPSENTENLLPNQGKLTFSRVYDSRPTGMLKGSIFENLTLSDTKPQSLINPISIIGRRIGPIYYNTQGFSNVHTREFASGVGQRSVTFEAFFPKPTGMSQYKFPQEEIDKIDQYMNLYKPAGRFNGYIVEDSQDLNLTSNKLTKTISWEYIICAP